MAKTGFILSKSEADRLAKVVKRVEAERPDADIPGFDTSNIDRKWVGVVKCTGPLGTESDFTDHRYWISKAYINGVTTAEKATDAAIVWTEFASTDPEYFVVMAENLAEQPFGTHLLTEGAVVIVNGGADVSGEPVPRFFFA